MPFLELQERRFKRGSALGRRACVRLARPPQCQNRRTQRAHPIRAASVRIGVVRRRGTSEREQRPLVGDLLFPVLAGTSTEADARRRLRASVRQPQLWVTHAFLESNPRHSVRAIPWNREGRGVVDHLYHPKGTDDGIELIFTSVGIAEAILNLVRHLL